MTSPRLALIDFDGTLADSLPWFLGVMNEVARRHGLREIDAAAAEALRGRNNRQILADLGIPAWKLPLVAATVRALAVRDAGAIRPFPFAADLLHRLADAGVTLAVVSSNEEDVIRRVLGEAAAARLAVVAGGASLFGKAGRFRQVIGRLRIPVAASAAIGDEVRDVEAARAAGIASLAVTWGYARADALAAARPTLLAHDPADLLAWFGA